MYKVMPFVILFVIVSLTRGENYYDILNIGKSANQYEIWTAFKKQAVIWHPDKNRGDPSAHYKYFQLMKAYRTLKDYNLRKNYDFYGRDGLNISHTTVTYYSWNYYENSLIYDDDEHIVILEASEYYKNVINSDTDWFVNFCSPLYSAYKELALTWKEIAKLLDGAVKIAVVDCEYSKLLCHQVGIVHSYPTLLYFRKHSQNGTHYKGEHTQEAIIRFALDGLNIHVPEISESPWDIFSHSTDQRPALIFIYGDEKKCFTADKRLIIAATFDKLIDVKAVTCKGDNCHNNISYDTHAVYLPIYTSMHHLNALSWEPIFLNCISDINTLRETLLDLLPSPQELSDNDFKYIRKIKSNVACLVCFYTNDTWRLANLQDFSLQMKKIWAGGVNLSKINCHRNWELCLELGVNRCPIWGMIKPGGAFELNYGKNTNNDILQFVEISINTRNLWSLSADETLSILQRNNGEVWFLVWFRPWYPPCLQFLLELRKASLVFDASIIRFGTIDCTFHSTLCSVYRIGSYHTAMIINGSNTHPFTLPKTAANIIRFINEKKTASDIKLTSSNINYKLWEDKNKVMWFIGFFVPWCASCQRLETLWIAIAKSLNTLSFVNVASIDCEAEISLCTFERVRSYPNFTMYVLLSKGLHKTASYNGPQDSLSILTWITTFLPKKIRDLKSFDYQKLLDSNDLWIVNFYLPDCWNCEQLEPELVIAAQLLKKVKFGRINCNFYKYECSHIQEFPTLILYNSEPRKQYRYGSVNIAATTAESIKNNVMLIINSHPYHDEL